MTLEETLSLPRVLPRAALAGVVLLVAAMTMACTTDSAMDGGGTDDATEEPSPVATTEGTPTVTPSLPPSTAASTTSPSREATGTPGGMSMTGLTEDDRRMVQPLLVEAYEAAVAIPRNDERLAQLGERLELYPGERDVMAGVIVRGAASEDALRAAGLRLAVQVGSVTSGCIDLAALPELISVPGVEFIEPAQLIPSSN